MSPKLQAPPGVPALALGRPAPLEIVADDDAPAASGAEPWGRRDLVGFAALTVLGAALLGTGYAGASAELQLKEQVPFLDLGIAGLLVAGVGGVAWLSTGLRAVRTRKAAVVARVRSRFVAPTPDAMAAPAVVFVAGTRMTRYHRPDCSLVAGKPVSPGGLAEQEQAGRRPCGVCVR